MTLPSILAIQTLSISLILLISATPRALSLSSPSSASSIYIVHVDHDAMPSPFRSSFHWHTAILSSLHSEPSSEPPPVLLYTYREVTSGFSAALTPSQAEKLRAVAGFLSAYADSPAPIQLLTTRTPEFLGLSRRGSHDDQPEMERLWAESRQGEGQIIGVVDTGIWPESRSFEDYNMPDVPRHWLGVCETGDEFNSSYCNRKLIGARSFSKALKQAGFNISKSADYDSARDFTGHGTHICSIAAGSEVSCAEFFGYAKGKAIGMAPKAHLAMYKSVFLNVDNLASDILAAIDQALSDGVTVLSLSIANSLENEFGPFHKNPIAVGTFAAMQKGVFVACAAGNTGSFGQGTIFNGAPWVTTVGMGTTDRDFGGLITLADTAGEGAYLRITGRSIFPGNILVQSVPVYYGHGNTSKEKCLTGALDSSAVQGKYVLCTSSELPTGIPNGAIGAIIGSSASLFEFTSFFEPWVYVSAEDANNMRDFVIKAENPVVSVKFQVTVLHKKPAPQVDTQSSRGPYAVSPWVFKPDLLAPGVEVLGATVPNRGNLEVGIGSYSLLSDFSLDSGTSFSAPHVAGIAALLRNVHPNWSPAAIRSAMMTTAYIRDNTNSTIMDMSTGLAANPLDYGAGHIDPNRAVDPGLVYDIHVRDYVNLLCAINYTAEQIRILTHKHSSSSCSHPSLDLNYPGFVIVLNSSETVHKFKRVVTYVGPQKEKSDPVSFKAIVVVPKGLKVLVKPRSITFRNGQRTAAFKVTIELNPVNGTVSDFNKQHGFLVWASSDGKYLVRSPIVLTFTPQLK